LLDPVKFIHICTEKGSFVNPQVLPVLFSHRVETPMFFSSEHEKNA